MSVNMHFLEKNQVVAAIVPVNLGAGPNPGAWVSLKYYGRCAIVFFASAGTVANDPTITLSQATDVSGTNAKALNFTRGDYKEAVAGQFTTVTQAAANTFTVSGSAVPTKIFVIDIKAEDLDVNNSFDCLQASVADGGSAAQLGCALYFLHGPRELSKTLPSAIVN